MSKKRRAELAASRRLNAEALRNGLLKPNVPVLCKVAPLLNEAISLFPREQISRIYPPAGSFTANDTDPEVIYDVVGTRDSGTDI
ncbi:MAG: hypothetical protein M1839_001669 [Geoglossum umbratile]|nr:MAG: hypothetical protein M1839_001669 [Geoglossum umbratile]